MKSRYDKKEKITNKLNRSESVDISKKWLSMVIRHCQFLDFTLFISFGLSHIFSSPSLVSSILCVSYFLSLSVSVFLVSVSNGYEIFGSPVGSPTLARCSHVGFLCVNGLPLQRAYVAATFFLSSPPKKM